jgi:hypothetical protein
MYSPNLSSYVRQLHRRARLRLDQPVPRFRPDPAHWRALVERFLDAARGGDVTGLAAMLADNVSSTADGGGKVGAARRTVVGRAKVARYLAGAFSRPIADVRLDFGGEVNGEQAVLGRRPDLGRCAVLREHRRPRHRAADRRQSGQTPFPWRAVVTSGRPIRFLTI